MRTQLRKNRSHQLRKCDLAHVLGLRASEVTRSYELTIYTVLALPGKRNIVAGTAKWADAVKLTGIKHDWALRHR